MKRQPRKPRSREEEFNPNSFNAQLATILTRLGQQDKDTASRHRENKETLDAIREQTEITNGRVTKLESWRTFEKGKTAGIALVVSLGCSFIGWVLLHFFGR